MFFALAISLLFFMDLAITADVVVCLGRILNVLSIIFKFGTSSPVPAAVSSSPPPVNLDKHGELAAVRSSAFSGYFSGTTSGILELTCWFNRPGTRWQSFKSREKFGES
jgi:hypothetical protein